MLVIFVYESALILLSFNSRQPIAVARVDKYILRWVALGVESHAAFEAVEGGALPQKSRSAVFHDRTSTNKKSQKALFYVGAKCVSDLKSSEVMRTQAKVSSYNWTDAMLDRDRS